MMPDHDSVVVGLIADDEIDRLARLAVFLAGGGRRRIDGGGAEERERGPRNSRHARDGAMRRDERGEHEPPHRTTVWTLHHS